LSTAGNWPDGVGPLDHTADVGLQATAGTLPSLLGRVASGMRILIEGEDAPDTSSTRTVERTIDVEAEDAPALLVAWLRELLYLHQVEGLAFHDARVIDFSETGLRADVSLRPAGDAAREIKGVTYHGLQAEERASGWHARIIFDV